MMAEQWELAMVGFDAVVRTVRRTTGLDLTAYRREQLKRRLRRFLNRTGLETLKQLAAAMREKPHLVREFVDELGINVTEFMRNRGLFDKLARLISARQARSPVRMLWSAGCSIGCEPYSLAIVMDGIAPSGDWRILATDIDEQALARAADRTYSDCHLKNLSGLEIQRYFERGPEGWQFTGRLAAKVSFRRLDLLADRYPTNCDVVLCRNVIIYFEAAAKRQVLERLAKSLAPEGLLFLGGSETVPFCEQIGLRQIQPFFYTTLSADMAVYREAETVAA